MRRPSFQFYHGDWRSNAKLRRCNHTQRGIWLEVMCLMADEDEFGVLRWPLLDVSNAVPCRIAELRPLVERDVMKGAEIGQTCRPLIYTPRHAGKDGSPIVLIPEQPGPIWYSSRMVRDAYIAVNKGASSRFTSENNPRKHAGAPVDWNHLRPAVLAKSQGKCHYCGEVLDRGIWQVDHYVPRAKGGTSYLDNLVAACLTCNHLKSDTLPEEFIRQGGRHGTRQGDGPSSSTASSSSRKAKTTTAGKPAQPDGFAEFRSIYPKRAGNNPLGRALKAYKARLAEGHAESEFVEGARRYADFIRAVGKEGTEFVLQAATFLGPDKPFAQEWAKPNGAGSMDVERIVRELEEEELKRATH